MDSVFSGFYHEHKLNYHEAFALQFFCTILLSVSISLIFSRFVDGAAKYLVSREKRKIIAMRRAASGDEHRPPDSITDIDDQPGGDLSSVEKSKPVLILKILARLCFIYAILCALVTPSVFSGLNIYSVWVSIVVTLVMFIILFIAMIYSLSPNFLEKYRGQNDYTNYQSFKRRVLITTKLHKVIFILFVVFAGAYTVGVPLLTQDTCLDFFNEGYGVNYKGFGLSTRFSRLFQFDTVCPKGKVCRVYATLPEDSSISTIINVHTGIDVESIVIAYEIEADYKARQANNKATNLKHSLIAQSFKIDLEQRGERYMHSAYLHKLVPSTMYYYEIIFNGQAQASGRYRTLPSKALERNMLVAIGGDAGTTELTRQMTARLSAYDLDAIIIGGDVGYTNSIRACYYSYDLFMEMFDKINEKAGRLVPLLAAVGNHDVGFNGFQDAKIDLSKNLLLNYYPQQSKLDEKGRILAVVPELSERTTYHYHRIGNMLHFILDSGYVEHYGGPQVPFMKSICEQSPTYIKIANFHVPMYPACWVPGDDTRTFEEPAKHWAPIFEKYKFLSIFENHLHGYKRTFPIKGGVPNPGGSDPVYFGDGNWGISPSYCMQGKFKNNKTGILESTGPQTHVWIMNVTNQTINVFPINQTGDVFDTVSSFTVSNYI